MGAGTGMSNRTCVTSESGVLLLEEKGDVGDVCANTAGGAVVVMVVAS